ncbi:helix-turn-helix domain-containing protein [Phaeobacter sp. QD34_3]|uniref:GlxA family transcriptional regulator n=1 Tax=unclassified Phaeobacter TaxID=2621772 RepID=UPI00237F2F67|nr:MULTISPECIES: helix-turn-helix domain-containing protein [unclassified Phaeobacter]MDE4132365.1 helix-turn-helix domain-containing protein [Phaeobacter sp. QD34_3]MDE4136003.1 helix-turn-helix domain-containing protein [Phaeobacter sp. QD34_24]
MGQGRGVQSGGWQFDILVCEGFVLTEMAAVTDTLRIANRVLARPLFDWTVRSASGGRIGCRSGLSVDTTPFAARPDADFAFVLGNTDPGHPGLSLGRVIQSYTSRGTQVYLLAEAAARHIRSQSGTSGPHTTHWENSDLLREQLGMEPGSQALAHEDGLVVTCAGMGATTDIVLALVGRLTSAAAQVTVANILLHDHIRDFASLQPFAGHGPTTSGDRDLDHCIRLMQAHIEDPLPIGVIVAELGLSNRSLERKFKTFFGTTPNGFYREMRLSKANNLLLNTTLSVREIGMACGFPNGFSSLYKSVFGITPFALRKQRRMHPSAG